ncbi:MAG: type VI secretion system tip protein VgrG [Candidatus Accumulibacter sp.]|jgi:type VI secretion system VgrG family protein|nr:type VI secretion system tip protein VgrG [Accumulibacter sp.]
MNTQAAQTERFRFTSQALPGETLHVIRFTGREGLNELFAFTIDLVSPNPALDLGKLLSDRATFRVLREGDREALFCGYPASARQSGHFNGYSYYTVELRPTFWKMTQIVQSAIFLEQTLKDTVQELLRSQQFFTFPNKMEFTRGDYPKRDFAMQYDESIYDYLCWRLEDQGAYYYFAQSEREDTVCFADGPVAHRALPDDPELSYSPVSGLEGEHIREILLAFSLTQTQRPRRVVIRSHSWKNPNKPIVGMADVSPDGLGDVYLTDEDVESDADAERLAKIRAEALRCRERVFSGESSIPSLRPGYTFRLKEHYNPGFNQDYLITDITHEGSQESFINLGLGIPLEGVKDHIYYRNSFHCIEANRPFRPEKRAPRAKIAGVVHAFIDGAKTDARPELDSLGRYKILFPFDVSGRGQGKASCWVRMAQQQVGKNSGMSFPLLVGTEVLVSFVDGNPDRPYITGALANAETGALTGNMNSNVSGFSTAGGNQLTFNDTAKKQGIDLRTASGSGLFMSSGSLDAMIENRSFHLGYSGIMSSTLSGIANSVESGYKASQSATSEISPRKLVPKILEQLGNNIFSAYGAEAEKEMADAAEGKEGNDMEHSKKVALAKTYAVESMKAVITGSLFAYDMRTFKKNTATSYVNTVFASETKASSSQEIYPDWKSITAMIITDITKLAGTVLSNESAKAKLDEEKKKTAAPSEEEITEANNEVTAANAYLATAKATNNQDKISAAQARKDAADKKKKDLDDKKKAANAEANAEANARNELVQAQQYYNSVSASSTTDEDDKKAAKSRLNAAKSNVIKYDYNSVKKELANYKEGVAIASELLPEVLAIITLLRTGQGTAKEKRGGILLNSQDANINLLSKDAIALQSGHGLWLRTGSRSLDKIKALYETKNPQISWGSRDIKSGEFPEALFNFKTTKVMENVEADLETDFLADSTALRYMDSENLVQNTKKVHKSSANKHIIVADTETAIEAAKARVDEATEAVALAKKDADDAKKGLAAMIDVSSMPDLKNEQKKVQKAAQRLANMMKFQTEMDRDHSACKSAPAGTSAIVVQNSVVRNSADAGNTPQKPGAGPGIYLTTLGTGRVIFLDTPKTKITQDDTGLKLEHKEGKKPSIAIKDTTLELALAEGQVSVALAEDSLKLKCKAGEISIKNDEIVLDDATKKVTLGKFTFDSSGKMGTSGPLSLDGSLIKIG